MLHAAAVIISVSFQGAPTHVRIGWRLVPERVAADVSSMQRLSGDGDALMESDVGGHCVLES